MGLRFTVLASGSAGNASLIEADGFNLLLDAGLGPRQLTQRLAAIGTAQVTIDAVLLTHTHGDHWSDRTFAHLAQQGAILYCHPAQAETLRRYSPAFAAMESSGAVRGYESDRELLLTPRLRCRPLPVRHDSGPTFGFRFDTLPDVFGQRSALGYASDLGCWNAELAHAFSDVDLLAIEFNHDVAMELASRRGARLVARVLGDEGHLSNDQAAALLREVLRLSAPDKLRHLVQLHLSRDCNRPSLAQSAARAVLGERATSVDVVTAVQHEPSPTIALHRPIAARARTAMRRSTRRRPSTQQLWLPGLG